MPLDTKIFICKSSVKAFTQKKEVLFMKFLSFQGVKTPSDPACAPECVKIHAQDDELM